MRCFLAGPRPSRAVARATAGLAACGACAPVLANTAAQPGELTPDQRAIIEQIARSSQGDRLQYAGAPTDPIGSEVRLPFSEGRTLTLIRTGTTLQRDGSVAWLGEV